MGPEEIPVLQRRGNLLRRLPDNFPLLRVTKADAPVNTPPPKGGGFELRLKAGSVRHSADVVTSCAAAVRSNSPHRTPLRTARGPGTIPRHPHQVIFPVPNTKICPH